jgi:DNA mismatch repair protein MSH5
MEDVKLGGPDVVEACKVSTSRFQTRTDMMTVKLHIEPTVVLVSTKMDEAIIDRLDPDMRRRNLSVDETGIAPRNNR